MNRERINDCLLNATRQTVMPHEVIVVDNRSTDSTVAVVGAVHEGPSGKPVKLLHQDDEQGLIPTRDYGLNHATGDILGRFDADCMIRPDWVEVVSGIFTEDPDAMGATGPVMYYDLPSRHFGLRGDNSTRKRIYRADDGQPLLFGSNMALRATAWREIADEVCQDKADVMHEDIDISLHLLGKDLKDRVLSADDRGHQRTSYGHVSGIVPQLYAPFQEHVQRASAALPQAQAGNPHHRVISCDASAVSGGRRC